MNPELAQTHRARVEEFRRRHRTGLVTLVFTDLVDSVALRRQLGDQAGTSLLQAHRQPVRETLARFADAEEIETAGDSFLLLFARPSDAVKFALLVQMQTRALASEHGVRLAERIGIHVGEVVIEDHERGPKSKDVYRTQIDVCARVMGLAQGGQILLPRLMAPGSSLEAPRRVRSNFGTSRRSGNWRHSRVTQPKSPRWLSLMTTRSSRSAWMGFGFGARRLLHRSMRLKRPRRTNDDHGLAIGIEAPR